jgi:hypothetical protein
MISIITIEDYNNFDFKDGQRFKIINSTFTIKNIDGDLFILDFEIMVEK